MKVCEYQVWRHKRTKREARVLRTYEHPAGYRWVAYRYRSPNPDSCATQMTRNRRMTLDVSELSFLKNFEFVA